MLKGFRDFILRGNVIDLAVAVVIGAAFTALIGVFNEALITPVVNSFFAWVRECRRPAPCEHDVQLSGSPLPATM